MSDITEAREMLDALLEEYGYIENHYLSNQVHVVDNGFTAQDKEIQRLTEERDRYKEALVFYSWEDNGKKASEALQHTKDMEEGV